MRPLGIILNTLAQRPPMSFRPAGMGWHGWHAAGSAREKGRQGGKTRARSQCNRHLPARARARARRPTRPLRLGLAGGAAVRPTTWHAGTAGHGRPDLDGWPISKGGRRSAALPSVACWQVAFSIFNGGYTHTHTHAHVYTSKKRERYIMKVE